MKTNIYIWIIVMALATGATRILPFTLIKKPIENKFIQSFLYYVPYVTLAVMTFPSIMDATQITLAGALALIAGAVAAWVGAGLFGTALACCVVVLVTELILV